MVQKTDQCEWKVTGKEERDKQAEKYMQRVDSGNFKFCHKVIEKEI